MSLPERETIVEVFAADDCELTAEVIAITPSGVTVEWGGEPPKPGPARAEWPGQRGLHIMPCTIAAHGEYGVLQATGEATVVQRRDAVRVPINVPVLRLDGPHQHLRAHTVNISVKGLLVSGDLGIGLHESGMLCIQLPDQPADPLCVEGRVLHNKEPGLLGMELLGLNPGQEQRIQHIVFEQQREILRLRHNSKTHLRVIKGGRS